MYERSEPLRVLREAPMDAGRGIFIFGAPRGGTSMVAGALTLMGVDMGERQGYGNNEDLDIQDARGPIGGFDDPTTGLLEAAIDRMTPVISQRAKSPDPWGWKDPHGVFYAEKIEVLLPAPRIIAIFRDPHAVAERVHMLTDLPFLDALAETLGLYQRAHAYLGQTQLPTAVVSYEKSLVRPERFIDKLSEFCGLDPSEVQVEKAIEFCYPERGHGQPTTPGWPREGAL